MGSDPMTVVANFFTAMAKPLFWEFMIQILPDEVTEIGGAPSCW